MASIEESPLLYGVVNGVYYTNLDRHQELNTRMYDRYVPSSTLQPGFSVRPLSSKYAKLPIMEAREKSSVPVYNYGTFNPEKTFNPGTDKAPWRGFAQNINLESSLRNQFFANQKNPQAVYIPSSKSDLYEVPVDSRPVEQPNPYLFNNGASDFEPTNVNPYGLGKLLFDNSTRYQLGNTHCVYDGKHTECGPRMQQSQQQYQQQSQQQSQKQQQSPQQQLPRASRQTRINQ